MRDRIRGLLSSVFVGFAPWVLMSILEGPHRFELAAGASCALALVIAVTGLAVGQRPKLLDLTAVVFFLALIVAGGLVGHHGQQWLDRWSGDLSNATLAVVVLVSILIRRPFTLAYAREDTEPELWSSPLFIRINYVITWVWLIVFVLIAAVGYIGDGPLHQPDNFWTNWVIQIGLVIVALRFTGWYPDWAAGRAEHGSSRGLHPHVLLRPLAGYIIPVGILVLVLNIGPAAMGIALIAVGVIVSRLLGSGDTTPAPAGS